jgi:formate hydrogenlyase subunit 3/multisubunit Na+/H+ antiporter MnhD subunit
MLKKIDPTAEHNVNMILTAMNINTYICIVLTVWPDQFVKKIDQNVAQPACVKILKHNFSRRKEELKIRAVIK